MFAAQDPHGIVCRLWPLCLQLDPHPLLQQPGAPHLAQPLLYTTFNLAYFFQDRPRTILLDWGVQYGPLFVHTFIHFCPLLYTFTHFHPFPSPLITISLSHFHFHTFTFTLSLLHFHFYTFTFTLSLSNFHWSGL